MWNSNHHDMSIYNKNLMKNVTLTADSALTHWHSNCYMTTSLHCQSTNTQKQRNANQTKKPKKLSTSFWQWKKQETYFCRPIPFSNFYWTRLGSLRCGSRLQSRTIQFFHQKNATSQIMKLNINFTRICRICRFRGDLHQVREREKHREVTRFFFYF